MPLERLKAARKKTIGTKQTQKAVEKGIAKVVYLAQDAEAHVTKPLLQLCQEKSIPVVFIDTMAVLGKACGIDVGSASAAIVEE
ncbi:MAG: 50S ribosomal protein L7Ae-like protein [Firmicutes bacterium]|nr:50S ribosomal protein L7Ae-like protein [Bacillota bacterium]